MAIMDLEDVGVYTNFEDVQIGENIPIITLENQSIAELGGSSAVRVIDEIPTGAINGSNATFTTAQLFKPGTVQVTLNGLAQRKGAGFDYITSGNNTLIFAVSPDVGDTILVDYEVV